MYEFACPVSEGIGGDVGRCPSAHMDRAGMVVRGRNCRIWIAIGNPGDGAYRPVKVHISGGCGVAVPAQSPVDVPKIKLVNGEITEEGYESKMKLTG